MSFAFKLVLTIQILSAIGMIALILVQHGKGADAGAAFGGGAGSASLFGASGGANFLSRSTAALATVFLVCTLALAYLGSQRPVVSGGSVLEGALPAPAIPAESGTQPGGAGQAEGAAQIPGR